VKYGLSTDNRYLYSNFRYRRLGESADCV